MKNTLIIVLIALFGQFSFAQKSINSLRGRVIDGQTLEPLPSANIYIPYLQKGGSTDSLGYYEIHNLPQGTFMVEVSYISYSPKVLKINVEGSVNLDIELSSSVTEMGEIVITGASATTEKQLNPIPSLVVNNISSGETSSTNIIAALSKQPGISQITSGGAISKPVIRGLGYNRVVVLNNSIRQEGQQWGDEHGIEIDEYSIDRVEIIKGPGSLMYGSDAMAGVINFLAPKPVENGKITGRIMTNYQSNSNLMGYSVMNAGNLNDINWLARISGKKVGNYSNSYDDKVHNSGFEEMNVNASVGINKKWGYSQLFFSNFDQTLGLVEGERDSLGNFVMPVVNGSVVEGQSATKSDLKGYDIGVPRQDVDHLKIGTSNKFFLNKSSISVDVAFQKNQRKEFADPLDEQATELFFLLKTLNYDLKYVLPLTNAWETSLGINGMRQTSENKGEEFLIPEYSLFDAGFFAFTQRTFNKVHISGGARLDLRSVNSKTLYLDANDKPTTSVNNGTVKFEAFERTFLNASGSIGGSYRLTDNLTAKVNFSRGFRSPNMGELGSNGVHEGTFRYEIGNSKLNPETSFQTDLGVIYNSEHFTAEMALFDNSIQNFIYLQKLNSISGGDSIIDLSDPAPVFHFEQNDANLYGGEVAIDIHPHPLDWLHFKNSFSFVRGKQRHQTDSTSNLPFIPAPKIQSELKADLKKTGSYIHNLYFKIEYEYTFAQKYVFSAYGTETPTAGYSLLNLATGTDILNNKGKTLFSIYLAANNLLNASYQSHLSRLKYAPENPVTGRIGVFNMGRNISVRLIVPLVFKDK